MADGDALSAGMHTSIAEFGWCSHVGRVRVRNEDALLVDPAGRFAILADGMGGYRGGDVAASMAVSIVSALLAACVDERSDRDSVVTLLLDATRDANRAIHAAGRRAPELAGMGSTLVVAVFLREEVISAHVGDSRLYRLREDRLSLLTRDHTMLQEQVDVGIIAEDEARTYTYRGLLTRGLGVVDDVLPDIGVHEALAGDVFMLCSDGLTDMLDDRRIVRRLGSRASPQAIATALVDDANEMGGRDNVSVVVGLLNV